jgi:5'-methylthioadenosine phosphorylase
VEGAQPFDPTLQALLREVMTEIGVRLRDFGTVAVTDGPRFPTVAEARWYRESGADLTNKTLMPETTLAHELGMGVVNLSFITDWAAGHEGDRDSSSIDLIRRRSRQASGTLVRALSLLLERVPTDYRAVSGVAPETVQELLLRERAS